MVMHSIAMRGRGASQCQEKSPDQTLERHLGTWNVRSRRPPPPVGLHGCIAIAAISCRMAVKRRVLARIESSGIRNGGTRAPYILTKQRPRGPRREFARHQCGSRED